MVSLAEHSSYYFVSLSHDVGNCNNCRCTVWMRNHVGLRMGHVHELCIIAHVQI